MRWSHWTNFKADDALAHLKSFSRHALARRQNGK
jgi:hypothetical protein